LASLPIPVVVLHAADARLQSLKPLLGQFNAAVAMLHDCRLVVIHADGAIERVSP
jgi:hypothetical protein